MHIHIHVRVSISFRLIIKKREPFTNRGDAFTHYTFFVLTCILFFVLRDHNTHIDAYLNFCEKKKREK